jgi:hypothetical protein
MSENNESVPAVGRDRRLDGWGPNDGPELSTDQAEGLQERDEPVAAGNFGGAFSGDLGNAEVADEAANAPETREPDTSLGHEGGSRYAAYEAAERRLEEQRYTEQ